MCCNNMHAEKKISFPFTNSLQLARERKELWRKKINKYEMQPPHAPALRMKVLIQISLSWSGFPTTQCTRTNSYEYERGNLGVVELSISHSHVKALAQHQQHKLNFLPSSMKKFSLIVCGFHFVVVVSALHINIPHPHAAAACLSHRQHLKSARQRRRRLRSRKVIHSFRNIKQQQ